MAKSYIFRELFDGRTESRAKYGLVNYLALIVRHWPRDGGGRRPRGLLVLQRGQQKVALEHKLIPHVPVNSTVATEVAEILLGTQFHKKKITASCFEIAEVVAQHLKLNLSWDDDLKLGAYLISCLCRAGYYELKNRKELDDTYTKLDRKAYEYELKTEDQEILDYPELNTYTSHTPFPRWTDSVDDKGRKLIKPSQPQPKENIRLPSFMEFESRTNEDGSFRLAHSKDEYVHVWADNRDTIPETIWIEAIHKLEGNPYRINQKLLKVVRQVWDSKKTRPKKTKASLERQRKRLIEERSEIKTGEAKDADGKVQFIWEKKLSKTRRTIDHLNNLFSKQKEQNKKRKDEGKRELPKNHDERILKPDLAKVRSEYWDRFYANEDERNELATQYRDFKKTKEASTRLGKEPFYQRAFLDHRGRVYLSKSKVYYQGGDMQRGLIEFAEGKQLRKKDWKWLWLHLGNLYGAKGTIEEVIKEAQKNKAKFLKWGRNPYKYYDEWKDESDRWQLIRACIELVELTKNPKYKSTLIIEIDQSTSCLQHIALFIGGDEGRKLANKVNLGSEYNDIYRDIGDKLVEKESKNYPRLKKLEDRELRKIVKMALVPWTYGGNAWTAGKEYHKSSITFLRDMSSSKRMKFAHRVIAVIEKELSGAVEFTQESKGEIEGIKHDLTWLSPSFFDVQASKHRQTGVGDEDWRKKHRDPRERIYLVDETEIRPPAHKPLRMLDTKGMAKAISPNIIHSIDASVVHYLLWMSPEDVNLVPVHDAIGTLARDMEVIRLLFHNIFTYVYSHWHPSALGHLEFDYHEKDNYPYPSESSAILLDMTARAKHLTG